MEEPKVFISYSWDSDLHKDWVVNLMNKLREKGVNTKIDRSITQNGTVNLNRMMIEEFKNSCFIVTVLTENYAMRANDYRGGVGLETMLLGNELLNNIKKIIPLKRSSGSDETVIPYCLKGLNYTDFSMDNNFDSSFNELLHRIYEVDMIEVAPIGKRPDLKTKKIISEQKELEGKEPKFFIKKGNNTEEVENGKIYETTFENSNKQKVMIDSDGYHVEFTDDNGRVTYADFDFKGGIKYVEPPIPWSEFKFVIPEDKVLIKRKYNIPNGYGYVYKFRWNKLLTVEYDLKGKIMAFEAKVRTEVNYNTKTINIYPDMIDSKKI